MEQLSVPIKVFTGTNVQRVKEFAEKADRFIKQNYYGPINEFNVDLLETRSDGTQFDLVVFEFWRQISFALGLPYSNIGAKTSNEAIKAEYEWFNTSRKPYLQQQVAAKANELIRHFLNLNFNLT